MVAVRHGRVFSVLQVIELCPRLDEDKLSYIAGNVLYGYIFITLWSIRAHLQPKQTGGVVNLDATENQVVVVDRFRTQCEATVTESVHTIFDDYIIVSTVTFYFGRVIGPRTFTTFHCYGIIVNRHIATLYQYIFHYVQINGVGAGALGMVRSTQRVDAKIQQFHVFAIVDVSCPESRVLKFYPFYLHILTIRYIYQSGALFVLVGALAVPFATKPELLVIAKAVTVDGSFTRDGESVQSVGIDQCAEVCTSFPFYASLT